MSGTTYVYEAGISLLSFVHDGRRGGEDDVGDAVALHGAEEGNAAADIDAVVLEGNLARLSDSLCLCQ